MNIKYIYFQGNLNYNDSKYNLSLIRLFKNTTLLKSKDQFKNITIYQTNINSSFIFISKVPNIKEILVNKTLLEQDNLSKLLTPIYNYSFDRYDDNFYFTVPFNGEVLLTFEYSNHYRIENDSSIPMLWFNEFRNLNSSSSLVKIYYDSVSLSHERIEYFMGLSIFIFELAAYGIYIVVRRLRN